MLPTRQTEDVPCLGTIDLELDYYKILTLTSVLVAKGLHEDLLISTEDQHTCLVSCSILKQYKSLADKRNPQLQHTLQSVAGYQSNVEFIKGIENVIADKLSRAPVFGPSEEDGDLDDEVAFTSAVTTRLQSDPLLEDLRQAAVTDVAYQLILDCVVRRIDLINLPPEHPARQLKTIWHSLHTTSLSLTVTEYTHQQGKDKKSCACCIDLMRASKRLKLLQGCPTTGLGSLSPSKT